MMAIGNNNFFDCYYDVLLIFLYTKRKNDYFTQTLERILAWSSNLDHLWSLPIP